MTFNGKPRAASVRLPARQKPPRNPAAYRAKRRTGWQIWLAPAFIVVYALATFLWRVPIAVGACYLVLSALTFAAYAADKAAARADRWRISERTLHLLALAGGWPGALIAQQWLRHKSIKPAFRAVFWITVAVNLAVFLVLCSPYGRPLLAALLSR